MDAAQPTTQPSQEKRSYPKFRVRTPEERTAMTEAAIKRATEAIAKHPYTVPSMRK